MSATPSTTEMTRTQYRRRQQGDGSAAVLLDSRQETASVWMRGLSALTVLLAVAAFFIGGNLVATGGFDETFNLAAAVGFAVGSVIPVLPWIGLFHVLSRVDEGDLNR